MRSTYDWHPRSFDSLLSLAEALAREPGLEELAAYCRLCESDAPREAAAALEQFLDQTEEWDRATKQRAVDTLLQFHTRARESQPFLSQPLLERLVRPVLIQWAGQLDRPLIPVRWLALLDRDPKLLARVLDADPGDAQVRAILADRLLGFVDHATRHLHEGQFIGDVDESLENLRQAEALIGTAPNPAALASLAAELADFRALLADWQAYQATPEGAFPDWCAARGRTYGWSAAFYYGQPEDVVEE